MKKFKKLTALKKNIAILFCICYNANRLQEARNLCGQRNESPNRSGVRPGILLFFYSGKAPTRLFVVLVIVSIKPFANKVCNNACRDRNQKSGNDFHVDTSSCCQVSVGQRRHYNIDFIAIRSFFDKNAKRIFSLCKFILKSWNYFLTLLQ